MSERLPTVGADTGVWGTVLNNYLGVGHTSTGTHGNLFKVGTADGSEFGTNLGITVKESLTYVNGYVGLRIQNTAADSVARVVMIAGIGATPYQWSIRVDPDNTFVLHEDGPASNPSSPDANRITIQPTTGNVWLADSGDVGTNTFGAGTGLAIVKTGTVTIRLRDKTGGTTTTEIRQGGGEFTIHGVSTHDYVFSPAATERMRLRNEGFLLLGTTTGTNCSAGDLRLNKALWIGDGITAPTTTANFAAIYVDVADGDLKIKFGDGTVKTIVIDT